jgi:virginiamycin B lyase
VVVVSLLISVLGVILTALPGVANVRHGALDDSLPSLSTKRWPVPGGYLPLGIVTGPDGALWFVGHALPTGNTSIIGRVTTSGVFKEFSVPASDTPTGSIAAASDGALWFTEQNGIGRVTTTGSFSEIPTISKESYPLTIVNGPDGALWFTEFFTGRIGRVTTGGALSESKVLPAFLGHAGIASGSDEALWLNGDSLKKIGRMTVEGAVTVFKVPLEQSPFSASICSGPDLALWFTLAEGIGRITTSGAPTEFKVPQAPSPHNITAASDGNLWFTQWGQNVTVGHIGRITTAGKSTVFAPISAASLPNFITEGPDEKLWVTDAGTKEIVRVAIP